MQRLLHSSKELDESFAAFILKTMPLAVMIVNNDVRVQGINEAAQDFLCISGEEAHLQKCGDVLKCIHARGPGGCGGASFCSRCVLRKSVLEALEGRTVSRNKGNFDLVVDGVVKRWILLVTASPIVYGNMRMVIVLVEDVSLVTQIQGLIPICSLCHCIRDDQGDWHSLQNYLMTHSEAELTHDFCPICSGKLQVQHTLSK
ncbi:histidine kinase [Pelosinus sp. sgz500959]|uniref:histidine kinase n=1 Tax=Pelosinus sp. sgz500959 TaxID=3242472 RepID=UPI00366FB689